MNTLTAREFNPDGLRFYINTSEEAARILSGEAASLIFIEDSGYMEGMSEPFIYMGPDRRAVFVSESDYGKLPNRYRL